MLPVRLDPRKVAVERAAAEADVRVDEDVGRDVLAVAFEPEARGPCLRGAHLEHAQAAPPFDVAVEEHLERVAVREPVELVPPELLIYKWENRVHDVVGLVPALGLRLLEPARRLAQLLLRAGEPLVEQQRNAVIRAAEGSTAAGAPEPLAVLPQLGAAERAADQLEQRRPHGRNLPCTTREPADQTPRLRASITLVHVPRPARVASRGRAAR